MECLVKLLARHVAAVKTCCCPTVGGEWSQFGQFVPPDYVWALRIPKLTERQGAPRLETGEHDGA